MFVLINYEVSRDEVASIHRQGCRDIDRDANNHGGHVSDPFPSVAAALADYIDDEMREMGYDESCVRVLPCTHS